MIVLEDRVALTTVRSPNKIDPKSSTALFFILKHFFPFPSTSDFRESHLKIPNRKHFSLHHTEAEISRTAAENRQAPAPSRAKGKPGNAAQATVCAEECPPNSLTFEYV